MKYLLNTRIDVDYQNFTWNGWGVTCEICKYGNTELLLPQHSSVF